MTTHIEQMTDYPPEGMTRRSKRGIREASRKQAEFHHEEHIPARFKLGASSRLGFKRRSLSYTKQKDRIVGHRRALVFTGRTEESVTDPAQTKITSTGTKGATLRMRAPHISGFSGRFRAKRVINGHQVVLTNRQETVLQIRVEVTSYDQPELERLSQVGDREYAAIMNAPGPRRRIA